MVVVIMGTTTHLLLCFHYFIKHAQQISTNSTIIIPIFRWEILRIREVKYFPIVTQQSHMYAFQSPYSFYYINLFQNQAHFIGTEARLEG